MRWVAFLLALWCGAATAQTVVGPCYQQAIGGCALSGPLTVSGATSLGTSGTTYVGIFGGTPPTTFATVSSEGTNASLVMAFQGTGHFQIASPDGGAIAQFFGSATSPLTDTLQFFAPISTTNPNVFTIKTLNGTPINFQSQWENSRGTIGAASTLQDSLGAITAVFNGQGGDTGQAALWFLLPQFNSGFQSGAPLFSSSIGTVIGAGTIIDAITGLYENINETGAGATVPTWTTGQAYVTGNLTQYQGSMWAALTSGTSNGTQPCSGAGTGCDTGVSWHYYGIVANAFTTVGGSFFVTSGFNNGGTSTAPIGSMFGMLDGFTANAGATFYNQFIGRETDLSAAIGASVQRLAGWQLVKIGPVQGTIVDWGQIFNGGAVGAGAAAWIATHAYVVGAVVVNGKGVYQETVATCTSAGSGGPTGNGSAITDNTCTWAYVGTNGFRDTFLFDNAVDPNGVAIEFEDQAGGGVGGLQTMAGVLDCILCNPTGTNTPPNLGAGQSGVGLGGGGYILRSANAQWLGNGDHQIGYALFHITTTGLSVDTTYAPLTGVASVSGGTGWGANQWAYDTYGNQGTVTESGGVPSAVTIKSTPFIPYSLTSAGTITGVVWYPDSGNAGNLSATGTAQLPTSFTATETYTAQTTLAIGPTAATALNIGNSGSTTNLIGTIQAGGTAGLTCSGSPTSSFASKNGIVTHC